MQQHICIIFVEKVQYSVVPRAKLPNAVIQMFGDVFAEPCSVIFQQLNVLNDLLVLYAGILVG